MNKCEGFFKTYLNLKIAENIIESHRVASEFLSKNSPPVGLIGAAVITKQYLKRDAKLRTLLIRGPICQCEENEVRLK